MRRLSMRGKRRKSETTSDSGSEENGVSRATDEMKKTNDTEDAESERKATPKKKLSRGHRNSQKGPIDEAQDDAKVQLDDSLEDEENGTPAKGGAAKRRKKEDQKASTSIKGSSENDDDKVYEVGKIMSQRTIKGRRQFLVRWKGYGEDSDTWEQEKDLNCPKLIDEFLIEDEENQAEAEEMLKSEKPAKAAKAKKIEKKVKASSRNNKSSDNTDLLKLDKDEPKEFEVEKIIEVHFKKNKMKEFLIRWKGFSSADDTWEPEENLNCPDLIAKFMQKVEKAKTTDMRELRTHREHTKRYTLTTHESGRRLSRRNIDKQRTTYHECDE